MIQSEACKQHGGKWIHSLIRGHSYAVPSTTPRRYRADHSLGRVLAHQCRQGLYRLHASPSVPPLFAARQRSATGGVRTLGALPPASMQSCGKAEFGQISRSFSLHAEIIIKRPKNLTQIGFYPRAPSLDAEHQFTLPSLRSVKSDRLLAHFFTSPITSPH